MRIIAKTIICLIILLLSNGILKSQEASVEKSVFGIQTGFWGVWVHNEARLSTKWALRTEVGLFDYYGLIEGIHLEPILTVEPRWYYNLNKRQRKGKRIDANSGNFVAFKTSFRPDVFTIPVYVNAERINPSFAFVPTWGTRKNFGQKFNYEIGFGLGWEYFSKGWSGVFENNLAGPDDPKITVAFNLHLRIGYKL